MLRIDYHEWIVSDRKYFWRNLRNSFLPICLFSSPGYHECQAVESNPWCHACNAQIKPKHKIVIFHVKCFCQCISHLMRNWTSAERVSISLLFASSPIVIFTLSFTKSLSCKTQQPWSVNTTSFGVKGHFFRDYFQCWLLFQFFFLAGLPVHRRPFQVVLLVHL